jgi:hypothetical protein
MPYDIKQSYFLDGFSLYTYFGVGVQDGSSDLLKFPDRKDSTTHDWQDENGIDIDLSRVFLASREATFNMWLLADDENDFWTKYNLFLSYLTKPGLRRLTISEFNRDYYVFYKKMVTLSRLTRVKDVNKVALKFSVTFIEQDPTTNAQPIYLTDEFSRFIIT